MNRRVQILRFWLLAIAAIVWAIACRDPMWAMCPIAFFTGQASCFCCAGCASCSGGAPGSLQIEVSGWTDNGCGDCTNYNGTFILPNVADTAITVGTDKTPFYSGGAGCAYLLTLSPTICYETTAAHETDELQAWMVGSTGIIVQFTADFNSGTDIIVRSWGKTFGSLQNCSGWSDEAIPATGGSFTDCQHDGSDVLVTGIA